jgi:organic hydroperoxide reductase OsmC/OhrA
MRSRLIVMEPAAYAACLSGAKAQVAQQAGAAPSGQIQVPAVQGASAQP